MTKNNVGRTGSPYQVKLRTGVPYKVYVPFFTPAAIQAVWEEVQKMQCANLIETSDSPYSVPMIVDPKPYGALRVCINFRHVNLNIVNDSYSCIDIEDQFDAMGGAQVFTTLDLIK